MLGPKPTVYLQCWQDLQWGCEPVWGFTCSWSVAHDKKENTPKHNQAERQFQDLNGTWCANANIHAADTAVLSNKLLELSVFVFILVFKMKWYRHSVFLLFCFFFFHCATAYVSSNVALHCGRPQPRNTPISVLAVERCLQQITWTADHEAAAAAAVLLCVRATVWPPPRRDAWRHSSKSLVNTVRTEKERPLPRRARQHVLKSCGCGSAAAVTRPDKLTYVFERLFAGHVSFSFKRPRCLSAPAPVACCQCHLLLFTLFTPFTPALAAAALFMCIFFSFHWDNNSKRTLTNSLIIQ